MDIVDSVNVYIGESTNGEIIPLDEEWILKNISKYDRNKIHKKLNTWVKLREGNPLQKNIINNKCGIDFNDNTIFEISNLPKIKYYQGNTYHCAIYCIASAMDYKG